MIMIIIVMLALAFIKHWQPLYIDDEELSEIVMMKVDENICGATCISDAVFIQNNCRPIFMM